MYGPFITFEIKVNPITHGGTGRVNPIPNGASVWNGPLIKKIVCLYGFLPSSVPVG